MMIVERVFLNRLGAGYEPTITSIDDRTHGTHSLHPGGLAFDVRTKDLLDEDAAIVFTEIYKRLNRLGFDVLWERRGQSGQHFHIEYDPKAEEA
jgi:hypothetical protein